MPTSFPCFEKKCIFVLKTSLCFLEFLFSNPCLSMKFVQTRIADVMLDKNGIIIIKMKNAEEVNEEDVLDLNLVTWHLSGHKPALKLVDARAKWHVSATAKKEIMKQDGPNKTIGRALIVSNVIKVSVLRFIKNFKAQGYPQEFFTDYDEAYNWLLKLKEVKKISCH